MMGARDRLGVMKVMNRKCETQSMVLGRVLVSAVR